MASVPEITRASPRPPGSPQAGGGLRDLADVLGDKSGISNINTDVPESDSEWDEDY